MVRDTVTKALQHLAHFVLRVQRLRDAQLRLCAVHPASERSRGRLRRSHHQRRDARPVPPARAVLLGGIARGAGHTHRARNSDGGCARTAPARDGNRPTGAWRPGAQHPRTAWRSRRPPAPRRFAHGVLFLLKKPNECSLRASRGSWQERAASSEQRRRALARLSGLSLFNTAVSKTHSCACHAFVRPQHSE